MSNIDISGLDKTYATTPPVSALQGVDLTIRSGEFVALLGPSGCGKSTLLNIIAGFEAPSLGGLTVNGQEIVQPAPERGVVFQEAALFPWLNVWDNVVFGPQVQGVAKSVYEPRAKEMLKIMGIARVLTMGSKILLMDEPFGALDAQTRLSMQELLLKVWQQLKPTVVFVTHDIDEALFLADTVYVMSSRPGRIQARLDVPFERPRQLELTTSAAFNQMKLEILRQMRH